MLSKIITFCFYLLFFATPLIWSPTSYELFEYNKMMFVYLLTIIITTCWALQMVSKKSLLFKRTFLDLPIIAFLIANILSTIFSIDPHTSVWGYYSRSNGGLLSIISYTLLYFALVGSFNKEQIINLLKVGIWGGLLVSLWAIPEHFGASPSCLILTHTFTDSCWVQDVQARVFASLGQPNWLAAYLAMLIFPAFYFLIKAKNKLEIFFYAFAIIANYLSFTFAYSRGATIGLLAGVGAIGLLLAVWSIRTKSLSKIIPERGIKTPVIVILLLLFSTLFFGSALTNFKLLSKFAAPSRPSISLGSNLPSGTQLENGGTESGQIRLIVWRGALEIYKHYPIFGSGVETFAYSYYNFRPIEHNLVSEWDFLYNKAHNEYLNYLATTGTLGFVTYLLLILTFSFWSIKSLLTFKIRGENKEEFILLLLMFASYITYLVQNLVGFSVVIVALFFYLFPAISLIVGNNPKLLTLSPNFPLLSMGIAIKKGLKERAFYRLLANSVVLVFGIILLLTLVRYYFGDYFFTLGYRANEAGSTSRAYYSLRAAVFLNPDEPFYRSELGYAAAGSAVAVSDSDATTSASLKTQAIAETNSALRQSPRNISLIRTAVRTNYLLSTIDPSYMQKTIDTLNQAITLAPTDPKLPYNKGILYDQAGNTKAAIAAMEQTVELKPTYREAIIALATLYFKDGRKDQAIQELSTVLKLIPNDPEAVEKLKTWQTTTK